jgi:hypothetical protein
MANIMLSPLPSQLTIPPIAPAATFHRSIFLMLEPSALVPSIAETQEATKQQGGKANDIVVQHPNSGHEDYNIKQTLR